MKKWIMLLLLAGEVRAQSIHSLTLAQAYDLAQKNYPAIRQRDLVARTENLTVENLQKAYLPQLSFSGQATYQSEVTGLNLSLPGFSIQPPAKDQYKFVADVNQIIYDGGATRQQKRSAELNASAQQQQVDVQLYQVKTRINQIFLSALLLDQQIHQAELMRQDVQVGIRQVQAQVDNGTALKSNLDVLKAESLQTDQHVIELQASKKGLIETLGLFLATNVDDSATLEVPAFNATADVTISRPELEFYRRQAEFTLHQDRLLTAKNLPKLSMFAEGGYGRPGLNLLKNGFDWFYIGGLKLNWPLGGLYTIKKDKELNKVSKQMIDVQKDIFLLNTNAELKQERSEVDKYNQLVATDEAIIELRLKVKQAALAQLENGVITANDYLREVNADDQARQSLILHRVQLLQAQINYQTTLGRQ